MTASLHLAPSTKILVIEDNEDDSFILLRDLKKIQLDGDVTVISNGHSAYNHLLETSQPPSLVFLDLELPGIGGLELLKKMRDVKRLRKVPVIVMTGSLNPKMISTAQAKLANARSSATTRSNSPFSCCFSHAALAGVKTRSRARAVYSRSTSIAHRAGLSTMKANQQEAERAIAEVRQSRDTLSFYLTLTLGTIRRK